MPVTPTYPGVYVEEIPSGVRTIVGVATSITAFVGRTRRGVTNEPIMCNNYGDFERNFGGLNQEYPLSYAVRDFFLNGGQQALIVRLISPNFANDAQRENANAENKSQLDAAKSIADEVNNASDLKAAQKNAQKVNDTIQANAKSSQGVKDLGNKMIDNINNAADLQDAKAKALADTPTDIGKTLATNAVMNLPFIADSMIKAAKSISDVVQAAADLTIAKNKATEAVDGIKKDGNSSLEDKAAAQAVLTAISDPGIDTLDKAKAAAAAAVPQSQPLVLEGASAGTWGNTLRARVDYDGVSLVGDRYAPLTSDRLFNLTVADTGSGIVERFINLATRDGARSVDKVLMNRSSLVRVNNAAALPGIRPPQTDSLITSAQKKQFPNWAQIVPFSQDDVKNNLHSLGVDPTDAGKEGGYLTHDDFSAREGLQVDKAGIYALDKADLFNILVIPPDKPGEDLPSGVYADALAYCVKRRAMLIVDPPVTWTSAGTITASNNQALTDLNLSGTAARNAVIYFPRVIEADPKQENQPNTFSGSGIIAGIWARTDSERGVWKAPAGIDAGILGIQKLALNLSDAENGMLNPLGINCLRTFPVIGTVPWGARTLRGADQLADEYKYVPVRRLALFIEESLFRGLKWVVFEPNDEPLWAQIRLNVGAFMHNLFRQGAFQGQTPREAYFVKCDKETTIQNDINLGIVNIVVGFAPLKPAEFVIVKLQQMAGSIQV